MSKNGLKIVNEPVKVTTFSKEQHQSDITIYRIDCLYSSEKEGRFYYTYRLPGVSINEVLSYGQNEGSFLRYEVNKR